MAGTAGKTRREILSDAAKIAAAASVAGLTGCFPNVGGRWPDAGACSNGVPEDAGANGKTPFQPATNAVVEVFRESSVEKKAVGRYVIQPDAVPEMLEEGLKELARQVQASRQGVSASDGGQTDSDQDGGAGDNPWKVLLPGFRPGYRIGLKVNALNGSVPTSSAVIRAIVLSLRDHLGVDPATIIVWDRVLENELKGKARYHLADLGGATLLGTVVTTNKATEGEPGYGAIICPPIEGEPPRISRILTDLTDVTINVPVLKTHNVSGVTAAMKNIYGIIDIPAKYHKPKLQTALPALYALPVIRHSLVLTIVDALVGVVTGDTDSPPDEFPRRLLLSQDPVAADNYALTLVNQLRSAQQVPLPPINSGNNADIAKWIDLAHDLKLGDKSYSLIKV